jgi:competence protein ComEA
MKRLAALLLVLNLNTATVEQFQRLPGVGRVLATRIVQFREKKGPFKRVEDLLAVPGMSERKWKALRPYLTVN